MEEYKFHTEDLEILIPGNVVQRTDRPFILAVGPSLTMIIPVVLMAFLSIANNKAQGGTNTYFMYFSVITGGTSCLLGAFWGISNHLYQKTSAQKALFKQQEDFREYLERTESYLKECVDDNRRYLCKRYQSLDELMMVDEKDLWSRYKRDEDFLFVRLKCGELPFQMRVHLSANTKQLVPSEEILMAQDLADRYQTIKDVPVGIDLMEVKRAGLIYKGEDKERCIGVLLLILMQLAILVDPEDLKVVVFLDGKKKLQKAFRESIKFMPHLYKSDMSVRFLADDAVATGTVSGILGSMLENEKGQYFLIIVLDDIYLREEGIYSRLVMEDKSFSVLFVDDKSGIPNIVHDYIDMDCDDRPTFKEADILFRKLSRIYTKSVSDDKKVPAKVSFLDLYEAQVIEDINVLGRWVNNKAADGIRVPIGMVSEDRKMYLDVHEKSHGPHGLIAGTTGSGKSELIQTYLLSLCMSYSPKEINFFLIDYKGGGTGNIIKDLPHCAGTISNLSGYQIERAMKAIRSENLRRQRLLASYGVNHIDAYGKIYREGSALEPMPHLLLIIDEFAELKKEEPEFMQEIISLSAVGRSLGIHLILATQKPAGVVDDKIWSNTRFRLCLRVQDKQDSMDMLHRKEAASLVNPGQCYGQIGNNESFTLFQTGYCGGVYSPEKKDTGIYMIDSTLGRYKGETVIRNKGPMMLKTLTEYVIDSAEKGGYEHAHNLWLEPLPIVLDMPSPKRDGQCMCIGMYDDPYNQYQGWFYYTPEIDGHLAIAGGPATGKTTFLKTLISEVDAEDEIILIDLGQGEICEFAECENCIASLWEKRDIDVFLYHLAKKISQRKKNKPKENLFIFIDNIQGFITNLTDVEMSFVSSIFAEGLSYLTYVISTGNAPSDFSAKIFGKIKTTACLEMNDTFWYGDMMRQYRLKATIPSGIPGRCLYRIEDEVYEGQILFRTTKKNDSGGNEEFEILTGKNINSENVIGKNVKRAEHQKFPKLPEQAYIDSFLEALTECKSQPGSKLTRELKAEYRDIFPVGYSLKSGLIRGFRIKDARTFLVLCEDKDTLLLMQTNMQKIAALYEKTRIVIIDNPEKANLEKDDYDILLIFLNTTMDAQFFYSELYRGISDNLQGIYIGRNAAGQRYFDFSDVPYSVLTKDYGGSNTENSEICGFMKLSGKKTIRVLLPKEEKEEIVDDYD